MHGERGIEQAFELAAQQYAELGVDVAAALERLAKTPISLHCWQGDDVRGFEPQASLEGSGIQATGTYPGRARTAAELRGDLEQALALIPGRHRVNLHAFYAETGGRQVDRNALSPEHFAGWIDWARDRKLGLDFNPTFFSHPLAADGFTLSSADQGRRQFWVEHGMACRAIAAAMGRALGSPSINNIWIPDGYKDTPADRKGPRQRLRQSLDEIFRQPYDSAYLLDSVEGKLFGIGSESYVVGSHEFYLAYALQSGKLLCLDAGHFHPTESVADKISSVLLFLDRILLHVSRGVRWDSDHVVILDDPVRAISEEIVRGDFLERVAIGLDFFDASINRIAAWVIGTRSMIKSLLAALLEPRARLRELEEAGDWTGRLALLEEIKTYPLGAVWDHYCLMQGVPLEKAWLEKVRVYEREVLSRRG